MASPHSHVLDGVIRRRAQDGNGGAASLAVRAGRDLQLLLDLLEPLAGDHGGPFLADRQFKALAIPACGFGNGGVENVEYDESEKHTERVWKYVV